MVFVCGHKWCVVCGHVPLIVANVSILLENAEEIDMNHIAHTWHIAAVDFFSLLMTNA